MDHFKMIYILPIKKRGRFASQPCWYNSWRLSARHVEDTKLPGWIHIVRRHDQGILNLAQDCLEVPERRAVFWTTLETSREHRNAANSWIPPFQKKKSGWSLLTENTRYTLSWLKKEKKHVSPRIFEYLGWLFRRKIPTVPGSLLRLLAIFLWQILPRWASNE